MTNADDATRNLAAMREMVQYAIDAILKNPDQAQRLLRDAIEDLKFQIHDLEFEC